MGRLTDTEQIRIYCNNNPGGVLDLSYASKRIFKDIPIDNLRKYLSRLCEEGVITKISKGIFLIGHSEKSDLERIINYYADDTFGMIAGEELLYRFGLIDYKPDIIEIFTNKTSGNKYIEICYLQFEIKNCTFSFKTKKIIIDVPVTNNSGIVY